MAELYTVGNPINRIERLNLNSTLADVRNKLNGLQTQINLITDPQSVEQVIIQIQDALNVAEQQASQLETLIDTTNTLIDTTNTAIDNANTATAIATNISNQLSIMSANLNYKGEYNPSTTYQRLNNVLYLGSTYGVLRDGVVGVTPTDDGINYTLVAKAGTDGTGAVSTVNSQNPDANGNVVLNASNVGAVSTSDFNTYKGLIRVNVLDFGADPTGVTDSTLAINQAIDSLPVNATVGGGVVYLPAGTYLCSEAINLRSGIILQGHSQQTTNLYAGRNDQASISVNGANRVSIRDLRIDGVGRTGVFGILLVDSTLVSIRNVWVESVAYGIRSTNTYYVECNSMRVTGTRIGWDLLSASNVITLTNCQSLTLERALNFIGSSTLSITGSSFEGTNLVNLNNVQGVSITGSYWEGMHENPDIPEFIRVGGPTANSLAQGVNISGNYFLVSAQHGIRLYGAYGVNIEGNYFRTSVSGINFVQADVSPKKDINIRGNAFDINGGGYNVNNAVTYLGDNEDTLNSNATMLQYQPLSFVANKVPRNATLDNNSITLYAEGNNLMVAIKDAGGAVTRSRVNLV